MHDKEFNMTIKRINFCQELFNEFNDIIDVRSPSEFEEDHVPQSINLPVLTDKERALVGRIYKEENKFEAKKLGAALISKNISKHISENLIQKGKEWKPAIYCWRGGQRSYALATILSQIGWNVAVMEGGYKSFRKSISKFIDEEIGKFKIVLITGNTGTAKTEMLKALRQKGIQIVDLEELANHKGSVFGSQGQMQPSQKRFETALFKAFNEKKKNQYVVLEAESNKIGNISIPRGLWNIMKDASQIELIAPIDYRSSFLITQYSEIIKNKSLLKKQIRSLNHLSGSKQVDEWLKLAEEEKFSLLATSLMENHYDPRYKKSRLRNQRKIINTVNLDDISLEKIMAGAEQIKSVLTNYPD